MSDIKKLNFELFKRIKKYKLFENIDYKILNDLRTKNKFKNIDDYIKHLNKSKYHNFTEVCKNEHPHRLMKKWGLPIEIIKEIYK
jgi:phage anti-repressor protein